MSFPANAPVGYKGSTSCDSGIVYAPYVPITTVVDGLSEHERASKQVRTVDMEIDLVTKLFCRFSIMEMIILAILILDCAFNLDCRYFCYIIGSLLILPMVGCLMLKVKYKRQRLDLIMDNL